MAATARGDPFPLRDHRVTGTRSEDDLRTLATDLSSQDGASLRPSTTAEPLQAGPAGFPAPFHARFDNLVMALRHGAG
ncbi:hypothetical protein [Conexibacter sp. DBS9H8]|uniref:hypothetical protein n=1 Tax=Conexibacter sp. DBS9H8 TaxID=2937801 RepID=UPI00200D7872|nr:hypothetical protein [Conexibacter sp. DBS9H8]